MASFIYKDAHLTVNAVDLSDHVRSLTLNYEASEQDETAMGDDDVNVLAGLRNWSVDVEWNQDYAPGKTDATLFPLVGAAAFAVKVRPVNTTISATNPEYQGNAILTSYQPLGGAVGDIATASSSLKGSGALTRATS